MNKKVTAVIALLIAAGAVAFLALSGLEENIVYYLTPTDLLAKESARGSTVRLGGMVQNGTLDWDPDTLNLAFTMGEKPEAGVGPSIKVVSKGAPPQMFREGIGCIVEGRYDGQVFHSERLMVKHSNEYKPPTEKEDPRNLYKTLLSEPQSGSPIPERPDAPPKMMPPGMPPTMPPPEPPVEEKL